MDEKKLSALSSSVLSCIIYFSLFRHPLTAKELAKHCHFIELQPGEIDMAIAELEDLGIISCSHGFYFLSDGQQNIQRRLAGEQMAPHFLKKASAYSRLISHFPFVRAVFISGSLSKGYMDENSDIDYFIITSPKRLWLCRTLLVLFKKIFLFNSHKHFCVNYFIDEEHLIIPDQNIFTATELVFVMPMYNSSLYRNFRKANQWTYGYYPNLHNENRKVEHEFTTDTFRSLVERILSGSLGEWLDSWFFRKTIHHWKKKFRDFDEAAFDMELRSRKNVSKHHPKGFQGKVLSLYESAIKETEQKHGIKISVQDTRMQESVLT
jgi:hypothetical protein